MASFSFAGVNVADLVRSHVVSPQLLWLGRCVVALFFLVFLLDQFFIDSYITWPLYLTSEMLLGETLYFIGISIVSFVEWRTLAALRPRSVGALCTSCGYQPLQAAETVQPEDMCMHSAPLSWYHKPVVVLYEMIIVLGPIVTIVFWGLIAPFVPDDFNKSYRNIHKHVLNAILIVADGFFGGMKVIPEHVVFLLVFVAFYCIITYTYYGVSHVFLYPFLGGQSSPLYIVGVTVLSLVLYYIVHRLTHLRDRLPCGYSLPELPEAIELTETGDGMSADTMREGIGADTPVLPEPSVSVVDGIGDHHAHPAASPTLSETPECPGTPQEPLSPRKHDMAAAMHSDSLLLVLPQRRAAHSPGSSPRQGHLGTNLGSPVQSPRKPLLS